MSPDPTTGEPLSQWQRLLKNTGIWEGSFTAISPNGDVCSDVRTVVELSPYDNNQAMHQAVRRYPIGEPPKVLKLDYRTLNRATYFFETGAFSQGSMQWSPVSDFGAELGLIEGDRRLRLVQLYKPNTGLEQLTLIRERKKETDTPERPPITPSDLMGTWQGTATTYFADLRPEQTTSTQLVITAPSASTLQQTLHIGPGMSSIQSTGTIEPTATGSRVCFTGGPQTVQLLLLPDGATATGPTQITPGKPMFLEVGWLLNRHTRQRLIRRYDASGAWETLTLVKEERSKF